MFSDVTSKGPDVGKSVVRSSVRSRVKTTLLPPDMPVTDIAIVPPFPLPPVTV